MTKTLSESNPSSEIDDYAEAKQDEFMRLLQRAYELKQINDLNFRTLSLEVFDGATWQEAFKHYENLYEELVNILKEEEIIQIQNRIIKGAEMIENESDPHKRKQYLAVFDQLTKKLERLEGREGHNERSLNDDKSRNAIGKRQGLAETVPGTH